MPDNLEVRCVCISICLAAVGIVSACTNVAGRPENGGTSGPDALAGDERLAQVSAALSTDCAVVEEHEDGAYIAKCNNGCAVKWAPPMSTPYITCPKPAMAEWQPSCAGKINSKSDGDPAGGTCWGPPTAWCADLSGKVVGVACSADGSTCCEFSDTCLPCGWQTCAKQPDDTAACKAATLPHEATCATMRNQMEDCALCGGLVVCPE